ncbi:MAG: transposase [Streptomycetales bacterium]
MAGRYRTYSPEFRDEAARMVVKTSRAIAEVARELGISETRRLLHKPQSLRRMVVNFDDAVEDAVE